MDLILVVGSNLSEWTSNGWSDAVLNNRLVHIDSLRGTPGTLTDGASACARWYSPGVRAAAANAAQRRSGKDFRWRKAKIQKEFRLTIRSSPRPSDAPIKPQYLMRELGWRSPPDTRFLTDTGNSTTWAIHDLAMHDHEPSAGGWMRVTMNFAPMGWAIGGAVGTALANRAVPVVCITGDGSLLMNGQEMTVALTEKLTVLFVILNDAALGMVKFGQRMAGAEQVASNCRRSISR